MTEIKNETYFFSLKIPNQKPMRFLKFREYSLERDILRIAQSVFNVERLIKDGKKINTLIITLDNKTFSNINAESLEDDLEDLFIQVLFTKIEVIIKHKNLRKHKKRKKFNFPQKKNLCLFSGGVDSLSGIFNAKNYYKDVEGIFVAHSDQSGTIKITNKIIDKILKPNNIGCRTIYAPKIGRGGYSQLRGFLYFVSAGVYLNLYNADNMIITECGPTMYQARFSPSDSITMTTHPIVLDKVKKVIENLIGRKINVTLPFENLTKSEVMSNIPNTDYLKETHSCISQAPFNHPYYHDGTCFGCVIKRIGAICVGVQDVEYKKDPFLDNDVNKDNLLSLMRFSFDVLTNYDDMPFFSKENIFLFNKLELFQRYSLDTFAALYTLEKDGKKLANKLKRLFSQGIEEIGEDKIKKRIDEIRTNINKPDFNKKVT